MPKIQQNPLITTLKTLQGNTRAAVLTEPFWGIPYNLFIPYTSLYMLALGLRDAQIGTMTSLSLLIQPLFAILSGAITDKFGRRLTTLLSDLISWCTPALIWAVAQDIRYFILAAVFNAAWRISQNSWTCLLVEDAEEEQLVHIWTWIYIANMLAAFFTPLAGLLVKAINLVPAIRILYFFAFIMMTIKAILQYRYSTETQRGLTRLQETKGQTLLSLLNGYGSVLKQILRTPRTLVIISILFILTAAMEIHGTFWSILVTKNLNIPAEHIAIYRFAKSAFMLLLYFILVPHLNLRRFRSPMILGFAGLLISTLILITMPPGNYWLLLLSILIEAISIATYSPLIDSLFIVSIASEERARINAILFAVIILLTSPFGWISSQLSELNRIYPFIFNIFLFLLIIALTPLAWHLRTRDPLQDALSSDL
jgi:MFS family permease